MSAQSEAMRLADALLEEHPYPQDIKLAAAELRRLSAINAELLEALRFILAFYEPGQTCLDTNAWKCAEASGRAAIAKAEGGK